MKSKKNILPLLFTLFVLLIILFLLNFYNIKNREYFSDDNTIVSVLNDSSGFFSVFFFTLNHYLYCKKHNISFKIESDKWLFKKELGWEDYFIPIEIINNNNNNALKHVGYTDVLEDFTIEEYRGIIPELYIYNETTKREIQKAKERLQLINKPYDSIFIRRGDKLAIESKFYDTEEYIQLLLQKNPSCKTIFLQTDDYNTYLDLQNYNHKNNLGLEIVTLCDENMRGVVVNNYYKDILKNAQDTNENEKNRDYLNKINGQLEKTKPVNEMTPDEKYEHTLTMIIGIEILANSNICICDYQSNVSRFIKLFHKNPDNVYDIIAPENDIDYQKKICPAYTF